MWAVWEYSRCFSEAMDMDFSEEQGRREKAGTGEERESRNRGRERKQEQGRREKREERGEKREERECPRKKGDAAIRESAERTSGKNNYYLKSKKGHK
jgi:hypothetical protein